MRIAEVIGKITLSRSHPSLRGARWLLGVSLSAEGLQGGPEGRGEPFVIYDELAPPEGAWIAVSEGAEASNPFHPDVKPIDAYNAAILDEVSC
jgi:ethanolamine utilization protein EutN